MKKTILSLAIFGAILFANVATATAAPAINPTEEGNDKFEKSTTGTWEGKKDGTTYWYKIDKNAKLWWSKDGKEWAAVADGMWADKDGKWLKIKDQKLVWTADGGKTWSEVPNWKWQGSDGKWYKFDKDWTLWVA